MADDYNVGYYEPGRGYGSGGGYTHRSKMPKANTAPGNTGKTTADDLILPRRNSNERD